MKLSTTNVFFVFVLSNLSTLVCAGGLAGGYERVFLWYAYRLSIGVYGLDGNRIASGCRGGYPTDSPIPCNFNQFIRSINGDQFDTPYVPENELFPDIDKTANSVASKNEPILNTRKIVDGSTSTYDKMMIVIGNIIADARQKDANKKFDKEFSSAEKALKRVLNVRRLSYSENKLKFLEDKFGTKVKLVPQLLKMDDLLEGRALDVKETIAANSGISDIEEQLRRYVLEFNATAQTKQHQYTMRVVERAGSTAFSASDNCPPTK